MVGSLDGSWVSRPSMFVIHRSGRQHGNADALYRRKALWASVGPTGASSRGRRYVKLSETLLAKAGTSIPGGWHRNGSPRWPETDRRRGTLLLPYAPTGTKGITDWLIEYVYMYVCMSMRTVCMCVCGSRWSLGEAGSTWPPGGTRDPEYPLDYSSRGKRKDGRHLIQEWQSMKAGKVAWADILSH